MSKLLLKICLLGTGLHQFWKTWATLWASSKVIRILKEGHTLPFWNLPTLIRSPIIINSYVHPPRNSYLMEALHVLVKKQAIEKVNNQASLAFFNQFFMVAKLNNKWRPVLDLRSLSKFLKSEEFKMETPECIRTSLETWECINSVNLKDV